MGFLLDFYNPDRRDEEGMKKGRKRVWAVYGLCAFCVCVGWYVCVCAFCVRVGCIWAVCVVCREGMKKRERNFDSRMFRVSEVSVVV